MRKRLIKHQFLIDLDELIFASLKDNKTVRIVFSGNHTPIHIECNSEDEATELYQELIYESFKKK